jgi:drug/metabolite transporter (DMT)-like permease
MRKLDDPFTDPADTVPANTGPANTVPAGRAPVDRAPVDRKPAPVPEGSPRMNLTSLALVLLSVALAACAQLILKHGMQVATAKAHSTGGSLVIAAGTSPWVIGGLAVFAVSAVFWLAVLSRVPLNIAYPFNAVGYLLVLAVSVFVLHEKATALTLLGSLLVASGIIIVVLSKP